MVVDLRYNTLLDACFHSTPFFPKEKNLSVGRIVSKITAARNSSVFVAIQPLHRRLKFVAVAASLASIVVILVASAVGLEGLEVTQTSVPIRLALVVLLGVFAVICSLTL